MFEDRCAICEFTDYENDLKCPDCGTLTDMKVRGAEWSWECNTCGYIAVTTARILCYWDDYIFPDVCYSKLNTCQWSERKNSDEKYSSICEKLGFIPLEMKTEADTEDDTWINPFSVLTFEEQDYLYYSGYLDKK